MESENVSVSIVSETIHIKEAAVARPLLSRISNSFGCKVEQILLEQVHLGLDIASFIRGIPGTLTVAVAACRIFFSDESSSAETESSKIKSAPVKFEGSVSVSVSNIEVLCLQSSTSIVCPFAQFSCRDFSLEHDLKISVEIPQSSLLIENSLIAKVQSIDLLVEVPLISVSKIKVFSTPAITPVVTISKIPKSHGIACLEKKRLQVDCFLSSCAISFLEDFNCSIQNFSYQNCNISIEHLRLDQKQSTISTLTNISIRSQYRHCSIDSVKFFRENLSKGALSSEFQVENLFIWSGAISIEEISVSLAKSKRIKISQSSLKFSKENLQLNFSLVDVTVAEKALISISEANSYVSIAKQKQMPREVSLQEMGCFQTFEGDPIVFNCSKAFLQSLHSAQVAIFLGKMRVFTPFTKDIVNSASITSIPNVPGISLAIEEVQIYGDCKIAVKNFYIRMYQIGSSIIGNSQIDSVTASIEEHPDKCFSQQEISCFVYIARQDLNSSFLQIFSSLSEIETEKAIKLIGSFRRQLEFNSVQKIPIGKLFFCVHNVNCSIVEEKVLIADVCGAIDFGREKFSFLVRNLLIGTVSIDRCYLGTKIFSLHRLKCSLGAIKGEVTELKRIYLKMKELIPKTVPIEPLKHKEEENAALSISKDNYFLNLFKIHNQLVVPTEDIAPENNQLKEQKISIEISSIEVTIEMQINLKLLLDNILVEVKSESELEIFCSSVAIQFFKEQTFFQSKDSRLVIENWSEWEKTEVVVSPGDCSINLNWRVIQSLFTGINSIGKHPSLRLSSLFIDALIVRCNLSSSFFFMGSTSNPLKKNLDIFGIFSYKNASLKFEPFTFHTSQKSSFCRAIIDHYRSQIDLLSLGTQIRPVKAFRSLMRFLANPLMLSIRTFLKEFK